MRVRRWLSPRESLHLHEEIGRLPRLTSASVEGDRVVAVGTVRALDKPLTAPLSQRPCVRYTSFAGTFEEEGSQRFALVLRDGDTILVDPTHAQLDLEPLPGRALENDVAYRIRLAHRDADGWATGIETLIEADMRSC